MNVYNIYFTHIRMERSRYIAFYERSYSYYHLPAWQEVVFSLVATPPPRRHTPQADLISVGRRRPPLPADRPTLSTTETRCNRARLNPDGALLKHRGIVTAFSITTIGR